MRSFGLHFVFFRFHFLSYNSPISRFCPSGDASYGEWAIMIVRSLLLSEILPGVAKCHQEVIFIFYHLTTAADS